jgi:RNA polymerase sigma-70 factor, ECF subfamily
LKSTQFSNKCIDAKACREPPEPAARLANEQQAVTHLKQGNIAGLAVLVQSYQVKAVHAALLIVRDRSTAEEIVQEAFLHAYRKINQFDERCPFGPWFMRSVIHAALKTAASQARSQPLEEPPDGNGALEWLIDPGLSAHEIAEQTELREAVWKALGQLTPNQRAAVVLRYFLDESESEMIQQLDRPLTTVKWWLHTARQQLRDLLRPFHETEMESQEVERE